MSQNNRTVVPGMDYEDNNQHTNNEDLSRFYTRDNSNGPQNGGTVVPGMEPYSPATEQSHKPHFASGKPVVGFLYSISRQGYGEYWPLHIGPNTIGSDPKCNICLKEMTVSSQHAELVIRKMKNPEKMVASLSDTHSTNGTMINKESLSFSAVECFNNDIITIGENYVLVLILIDATALGLSKAEHFLPIEEEDNFNPIPQPEHFDSRLDLEPRYTPNQGTNFRPTNPTFAGGAYDNEVTVGMNGERNINKGGTIPLNNTETL
jgi:pSer/pThr/pTyr-binding forkhead associated (FHA) protein